MARLAAVGLVLFLTSCGGSVPLTVSPPPSLAAGPPPTEVQTPTTAPQPSLESIGPAPTATPFTRLSKPFPWDGLGVQGSISFLTYNFDELAPVPFIVSLNLADGEVAADWRPPDNAWLANMALSPDGALLAVAYAPPPADGRPQPGYTGIYLLPGSCLTETCPEAIPQPLVPQAGLESSITPVWSPDGKFVYFVHISTPPDTNSPEFDLERIPAEGGEPELLVDHAIWPRPAPDGAKLAYVAYDPPNGINDLYLAAPDGRQAVALLPPGTFVSVDAPQFTPDGQMIYFSATGVGPQGSSPPPGASLTWWDRLYGVQAAEANGAPSEWWRMSAAGGQPQRLTQIATAGLSGGFSPDGKSMAFISYRGLGLLSVDSAQVTWLLPVTTLGDVVWLGGG